MWEWVNHVPKDRAGRGRAELQLRTVASLSGVGGVGGVVNQQQLDWVQLLEVRQAFLDTPDKQTCEGTILKARGRTLSGGTRKSESVREAAWRLDWEGRRGGKGTECLGRGDRKDSRRITAEGQARGVPFGVGPL